MDHDLRDRTIREAAYQLYAQRGYVDGFELDDGLEAEAMVDRLRGTHTTNSPSGVPAIAARALESAIESVRF